MKTITFHCETITPMFLAGADGKTPELRPPSIKGALRFWWRAMNGHLVEKKKDKNGKEYWDYTELKKQEAEIFGGTDRRSNFLITVKEKELELLKVALLLEPRVRIIKKLLSRVIECSS